MGKPREGRKERAPIEITPREARQAAPPPGRGKRGRTPRTLIVSFAIGLGVVALAIWIYLFMAR